MSVIPCYRGGHNCSWPACPLDCDGRPGRQEQLDKETCMCGSPMDQHTMDDGHAPLSMYDYYKERNNEPE